MAKNCIDILKDDHPKVHDYLRKKAGIDFNPESEKVKNKWEQAAKELQHDTLDALHNAYNKIGVSDYETPTTQRPVAPIKPAVVTPAQNKKPVIVPLKKTETKIVNPLEDKLDYLSHTAEDFDEFQRIVSADPEIMDYLNDQLAATSQMQDRSEIGKVAAIQEELMQRFEDIELENIDENKKLSTEESTKLSDALFAFADKILKADITGAGGTAALSNLFAIPQQILGRAVQAVAAAIKAGETIASAVKKGLKLLDDEGHKVDERDLSGLVKSMLAGKKPAMGRVRLPPPTRVVGTQTGGGTGANFNFFKNRVLPASGKFAEYESKETMEEGTGKPITQQPFEYDKKELDELELTGQNWIADAKKQFNTTPTAYAERLFDDVKRTNARPSVRGLGMVSLLNSIDNDLEFDDTLTYGQREKLAFVRRGLELEIAKNAREGSLTLNVQRLIYKLYNGEYKFTETIEPIVTAPVSKMADDVIDKMRDPDSDISDVVREQHRNKKDVSEPAPVKETPEKAAKATSFFVKLQKGTSQENVDKLKKKITEIANKINCGKKK